MTSYGLVLHEHCKSKQMTDFIAWLSRCHDTKGVMEKKSDFKTICIKKNQDTEALNSKRKLQNMVKRKIAIMIKMQLSVLI